MDNLAIIESLCRICSELAHMVYELTLQSGMESSRDQLEELRTEYMAVMGEDLLEDGYD